MLTSPLLGGGYLRLPVSQAIDVGTLRALCQEGNEAGDLQFHQHAAVVELLGREVEATCGVNGYGKKMRGNTRDEHYLS